MNNAIYKAKQRAERYYSNGELKPKKRTEKQVLTCGEQLILKNFKNKQNEKSISKYSNLISCIRK